MRSIRILQVVGGMNQGGTENWLLEMLRRVDPSGIKMDFLVHGDGPQDHEAAVISLGSRLLRCPDPSRIRDYTASLRSILSACEPYDIVHSHIAFFSGFVLRLAHESRVPVRIAHAHGHCLLAWDPLLVCRHLAMRELIRRHATLGLAASPGAGEAFFGKRQRPPWRVLRCGIELSPFSQRWGPAEVRREFGLPVGAMVVGHVGRFDPVKNHRFLLKVVREIVGQGHDCWCLFVGDGPYRPAIEQMVRDSGISDRVILTGSRHDVARILLGAVDVMVIPSVFEGGPLAAVEAQAAGKPCVISEGCVGEIVIVDDLVRRLSLRQSPKVWADAVIRMHTGRLPSAGESFDAVRASSFNVTVAAQELERAYLDAVA